MHRIVLLPGSTKPLHPPHGLQPGLSVDDKELAHGLSPLLVPLLLHGPRRRRVSGFYRLLFLLVVDDSELGQAGKRNTDGIERLTLATVSRNWAYKLPALANHHGLQPAVDFHTDNLSAAPLIEAVGAYAELAASIVTNPFQIGRPRLWKSNVRYPCSHGFLSTSEPRQLGLDASIVYNRVASEGHTASGAGPVGNANWANRLRHVSQ